MKERKEQTKGENIVFYLTPSDWLRERDVGSGLLFIEFRSDWFLCACSVTCVTERQRKVALDRFECVAALLKYGV